MYAVAWKRLESILRVLLLLVDKEIFSIWLSLCFKNDEHDISFMYDKIQVTATSKLVHSHSAFRYGHVFMLQLHIL